MHLAGALEVARQIDYVGGDPDREVKDAEYSQDSRRMLVIGLKQEQETIKHYRERISQAERSGEFALSEALGDYRTGTRSQNRSDRRHRLTMVIDELSISQCQNPESGQITALAVDRGMSTKKIMYW